MAVVVEPVRLEPLGAVPTVVKVVMELQALLVVQA
jgi:hypothetical protein